MCGVCVPGDGIDCAASETVLAELRKNEIDESK
jgi:hypothetical protein